LPGLGGLAFLIVHAVYMRYFAKAEKVEADASRTVGGRTAATDTQAALPPRRFAKYPLANTLYHGAIIVTGLSAIGTGVFMMSRYEQSFSPETRICSVI
jgi:hypothetical protein